MDPDACYAIMVDPEDPLGERTQAAWDLRWWIERGGCLPSAMAVETRRHAFLVLDNWIDFLEAVGEVRWR